MSENNKLKQNTAITLIALVVTIIVLLILAGITLTLVLGENGLFSKARNAKEQTEIAQAEEDINLKILEASTINNGAPTKESFLQALKNASDQYTISLTQSAKLDNSTIKTVEGLGSEDFYVTNETKYPNIHVKVKSDFTIESQVSTTLSGTQSSGGNSQNSENNNSSNSNTSGQVSLTQNSNEISFGNGNTGGFVATAGTVDYKSYGLTYKTFPNVAVYNDGYFYAICKKEESRNLGNRFEISAQINYNNENVAECGSIYVSLFKDNKPVCSFGVGDGNNSKNKGYSRAYIGENETEIASTNGDFINNSGRYALVGDGSKVYFYIGPKLVGQIDYTDELSYDTIQISFAKKESNDVSPFYVESLYIGEPYYYKDYVSND